MLQDGDRMVVGSENIVQYVDERCPQGKSWADPEWGTVGPDPPPPPGNPKLLYVPSEILVRASLEKQLDPLGPIVSQGRFVRPSVQYIDDKKETLSGHPHPDGIFWIRPCKSTVHFSGFFARACFCCFVCLSLRSSS